MGTAMTISVREALLTCPENIKTTFKRIIASVFFNNYLYKVEIQTDAKILCLFSHSYAVRTDLSKIFNKVTNLLTDRDILLAEARHNMLYLRGILLLFYLPIWLIQMRKIEIGFQHKLYLLSVIAESKKWTSSAEFRKFPSKYNLLVTFCDAHLADNLMTQCFKKAGVTTATLQHGWYRKTLKDIAAFSGIEVSFEGFISDKFLVWGEYAKMSAIQSSGIKPENIVCIGHPAYIGCEKKQENCLTKNIFGIILGRSNYQCYKENRDLIKIANSVSYKLGINYVIKYHPGDTLNECRTYDDLVNQEFLYAICDKDSSLEAYITNVDFSIVGSSSVYVDLMYMGGIAFRYTLVRDDYDLVQWGNFESTDDLLNLIQEYQNDKEKFQHRKNEVRHLLCGKGDIADNYRSFFNNYM